MDTHEHLVEESSRLDGGRSGFFPSGDWADLLFHYTADDLLSAGWGRERRDRFFAPETPMDEKVALLLPVWDHVRHTGYGRGLRESIRALYGEDDLTPASIPRIAEKFEGLVAPGFYRRLLVEEAGLVHAQVNSLEGVFCRTAQPGLLAQDISFWAFTVPDFAAVERDTGESPDSMEAWCGLIDRCFDEWAPSAVAAKNQIAYMRRLDFTAVDPREAERVFLKLRAGETVGDDDRVILQNHLFRHCLSAATRHGLPVKLHTGYYAGSGRMPLARVGASAADLCVLLQEFPETKFVLMHIGWPFQDQFLALAKQFPNVWIDMCWTWIINPEACERFVREFLTTVPSNKLLPFGGDFLTVECVVGHARIARKGMARALSGLVDSGWLSEAEALELVPRVFHGNARALFPDVAGIWDSLD